MQHNISKLAEQVRINPRYDLSTKDLDFIYNSYYKKDAFTLIDTCFRVGYIQGQKALKAEAKKGGK